MINEPDLVSVILPVHNGANFLREALDSVLSQSDCLLELIAVDDGSSDSSAEILSQYARADRRVKVLTQANAGVTAARNNGLARSQGRYIAFIDQDDRWTTGALAAHLTILAANDILGFTLGHQVCFLQPGAKPPAWFELQQLDKPVAGYLPGALCARRSVFEDIGLFDERFTISSDADWFARARDAGITMQLMPEVTLERRIHKSNQSRHADVVHKELFQVLRDSIQRKRAQS